MKGKKCFGLLPVLFTIFGLSLSVSSSVNAYDGWVNNPTANYVRAYYADGIVQNSSFGYQTPSFNLLTVSGNTRYFYGFRINEFDVSGGNYKSSTTLYADLNLIGQSYWWQDYGTAGTSAFSVADTSGTYYNGSCTNNTLNSTTMRYSCSIALPSGVKPSTFNLRVGNVSGITQSTLPLAIVSTSNLVLSYFGWGYDTASSEEASLLQQQINQNQTIINQNNTTNNLLEEQNQQDQQDRDNIESQQSDIESDSSDLGSDAESATSTLSGNISSIIGAFSTNATDCIIPVNTGNLNLNNLNICSIPSEFRSMTNNISSIVITVAVLWTSYSIIRQFLSIYESFLAGGRS